MARVSGNDSDAPADQELYVRLIDSWLRSKKQDDWERLWHATRPLLLHVVKVYGLEPDIRHDLVTDCFNTKILRNLERYDPARGRFTTWAGRVMTNYVRDHLKRRRAESLEPKTAHEMTSKIHSVHALSIEDYEFVKSFVPFKITLPALERVASHMVTTRERITQPNLAGLQEILDSYRVAWRRHGEIADIAICLYALIRRSKASEDDVDRVRRGLNAYAATSPLGLLKSIVGTNVAAELVLMFGGTQLPMPSVVAITSIVARR